MKPTVFLETDRLVLRSWQTTDYEPFILMNMDPQVRKYFPNLLTREESRAHIVSIEKNIAQNGFGLFAAEWKETAAFIGFIGFSQPGFQSMEPQKAARPKDRHKLLGGIGLFSEEAQFPHIPTPCIEIGWRLSPHYWGKGLATEGAKACLQAGFDRWGLHEIYSFTSIHNRPSENVMIHIGMTRQGTFAHPSLPADHWLSEHLLYKRSNPSSPSTLT